MPHHCCRSTYKAVKGLPIMSANGVRIMRNACVAAAAVSILLAAEHGDLAGIREAWTDLTEHKANFAGSMKDIDDFMAEGDLHHRV